MVGYVQCDTYHIVHDHYVGSNPVRAAILAQAGQVAARGDNADSVNAVGIL
jgi:hypothetical protein